MVKTKREKKSYSRRRNSREGSLDETYRLTREGSVESNVEAVAVSAEDEQKMDLNNLEDENISEEEERTEQSDTEEELVDEKEDKKTLYSNARLELLFQAYTFISDQVKTYNAFWGAIVLLLALACFLGIGRPFKNGENVQNENRIEYLRKTLSNIRKDFPAQKQTLWYSVMSGIKYVNESRPTRPAVFLLLHSNTEDVAECLAWKIANAASKFLETPGVIELPAESAMDFTVDDLISNYRDQLKRKAVMIVYKLDQFSGVVAKGFHSFCDTYNPLVARAVFLFTLNNTFAHNYQSEQPNKKAKEVMKSLWKNALFDSTLDPLITRLTDSVFEIKSENYVSCTKS